MVATVISVDSYYYTDISDNCNGYLRIFRKYSYLRIYSNNSTVFARLFPYFSGLFAACSGIMFVFFLRVLWTLLVCVISLYCWTLSASVVGVLAPSVRTIPVCAVAVLLWPCGAVRPDPLPVLPRPALCCACWSGVLASVRVRRWSGVRPAVLVRMSSGVVSAVGSAARVRCSAARPCPDPLRVSLRAFVHLPACAPARACAGAYPRGFGAGQPPSSNPSESRKKQKRLLRKYT